MRLALGVLAGAVVAAAASVILGEYTFVGATPWIAALVVPLAVAESAALLGGRRPLWLWPLGAAFGAAGLAWGVWLSTGRGLDPWPTGGWEAMGAGAAWPLVVGALLRRRTGSEVS